MLEHHRRVFGEVHPDAAKALENLGGVLAAEDDRTGAEAALRESLRIRRVAVGPDHRDTALSMIGSGLKLESWGLKRADVRKLLQEGVAVLAAEVGEEDPRVKAARAALGDGK